MAAPPRPGTDRQARAEDARVVAHDTIANALAQVIGTTNPDGATRA